MDKYKAEERVEINCLKSNRERCSEGMAEIKFKNKRHIISVCTFVPRYGAIPAM
jgi:hypothetical protein